nr:hypothetical protein [uncultured Dethiosulfovibrio sp.]
MFTDHKSAAGKKRFKEICGIEPGIAALAKIAKGYRKHRKHPFCANAVWYGGNESYEGLKERLEDLVGWFAAKPELRNEQDYDIAYDTIYNLLPSCEHVGPCC